MPEKKEVRKTNPIARDPTIAEERERKKPQREESKDQIQFRTWSLVKMVLERNYRF